MSETQFALVGAATLIVVAVDQVTKRMAQRAPATGTRNSPAVRLQIVRNHSAMLGRFAIPRRVRVASGILGMFAVFALCAVVGPLPVISVVGLGVATGGGLGNIADLLTRGAVVDFIVVGRWPIFNVADVALWTGLVLTVAGLL